MADLNEHLPVPIEQPKETKNMKLMWLESRRHEMEKKICEFKRQLEGAELTLKSLQDAKERLINSVGAEEVK